MALALAGEAVADKRVALVIGNADYQTISKLKNPTNDAADVAQALKDIGFNDVILRTNVSQGELGGALAEFNRKSVDADAAVFYYAGHGVQNSGHNYLLPVDIDVQDRADVRFKALNLEAVQDAMDSAAVKILILDACRDDPFTSRVARRSINGSGPASRGLARIERAEGSIIVFAASPGQSAVDGVGRNSPFAAALVKRLEEPHVEVYQMFTSVARDVYDHTNGAQLPEYTSSLRDKYFLNDRDDGAGAWTLIKSSTNVQDYVNFIQSYPNSASVGEAQSRIDFFTKFDLQRKAAQQEADQRAQLAAQKEAERLAQIAAQKEAERAALETARKEAERRAAELAQQAALIRQQADLQVEAEKRARAAAQAQAEAQAQQLAQQEIDRRAQQIAAQREAERLALAAQAEAQQRAQDQAAAQRAQAEADRLANEKRESDRLAELQRRQLAQQQAEAARLAAQQAEAARLAEQKAAADRAEAEKRANNERIQLAMLEDQKQKQAQAEQDRQRILAICNREGANLKQLVELRRRDEIAALGKQAQCPTVKVEIDNALRDLAAQAEQACKADRKVLAGFSGDDAAKLRDLREAMTCESVRADADQRIAKLEDASRLRQQSCADDQATLSGIDPYAMDARQNFTKLSSGLNCAALKPALDAALAKLAARALTAQTELSRLGCFAGSTTSLFDRKTRDALARFLSVRNAAPTNEIRVTDDFLSQMQALTDRVCPEAAPASTPAAPVADAPEKPARRRPVARLETQPDTNDEVVAPRRPRKPAAVTPAKPIVRVRPAPAPVKIAEPRRPAAPPRETPRAAPPAPVAQAPRPKINITIGVGQ